MVVAALMAALVAALCPPSGCRGGCGVAPWVAACTEDGGGRVHAVI